MGQEEFPKHGAELESRRYMDMSETWPPSTPDDAADAGDAGAAGAADSPTAESPIPLGPAKPAYWREYPYAGAPQGDAPESLPAGRYPTNENPTVSGPPTPPAGTWPPPPDAGWSAGGAAAPGSGGGGGPGGPTPPFGGWPPAYPAPAPQSTSPKKRSALVVAMAAVFAIVAVL